MTATAVKKGRGTKSRGDKAEKAISRVGKKKQALNARRGKDSFLMNPFDLVILGKDTSDPPEGHGLRMLLRKNRIDMPLEQDMLDSIKANGVEHAITTARVWLPAGMSVHSRVLKEDEQHVIAIDGRRRTLHTRHLCIEDGDKDGRKGTYQIKVWAPKTGMTIQELARLSVELDHTSRHDDVLEKAEQSRIMFAHTKDKAWVAKVYNVDIQTLDSWWKLRAEATPKVIDAVRSKAIAASAAAKLVGLSPSKQDKLVDEAKKTGKTSVKQIDGMVKRTKAESNGVKPSELPDVTPSKRQLSAAIDVIEDADLDIPDEFLTREKAWTELLRWVTQGIVAGPAIADLAKKSEMRMNAKRTDGDTRVAAENQKGGASGGAKSGEKISAGEKVGAGAKG